MKLYDAEVLEIGATLTLRSKAFFAVQRWMELMDDSTPFSLSVHSYTSPITLVNESLEMLCEYRKSRAFRYGHLVAAIRRVQETLRDDRIFQKNEFLDIQPARKEITSFMKTLNAEKAVNREAYLVSQLGSIETNLHKVKENLDSDYVRVVMNDLERRIKSIYTDNENLKRLDDALTKTAVEVVRVGRSSYQSGRFMRVDLRKKSNPDCSSVFNSVKSMLTEQQKEFHVAIVLDRVESLIEDGLPQMLHFRTVRRGHEFWNDGSLAEDKKLKEFCLKHWSTGHSGDGKSGYRRGGTIVKIVRVQAWDVDDARARALREAELLVDLVNANNRTRCVGVKRKVLVRDVQGKKVIARQGNAGVGKSLRPLRISDPAPIARSLRFASRANDERSWVTSVLFYWISMESFFSEHGDAAAKVQKVVPRVMARTAARDVVSYWRQLIIASLSRDIGFPNWEEFGIDCDPDRTPTLKEVAESLADDRSKGIDRDSIPLYVEYRLNRCKLIFSSPSLMADWVEAVRRRTAWALERAVYIRNQAVHTAAVEAEGELSLSYSCREFVDATFEVVALWSSAGADLIQYSDDFRGLEKIWSSLSPVELISHAVIRGPV